MKKFVFASTLLAAFAATGCIKTSTESTVNNDGSASVKMKFSYKKEVIANLKAMAEAQMGGEDDDKGADIADNFKKFESGFDDKAAVEEWKKLGLEVAKSAPIDKDGWKGVEIEGNVKNLTEYGRKHADLVKSIAAEAKDSPMAGNDPRTYSLPSLPRFFKTDQPNVAKVVLNSAGLGSDSTPEMDFESMEDEQREMIESQLDQARSMFGLDDMKVEIRVKLPGKILSVSNAKQDGENTIVYEMLGSNFNVDMLANLAKTKGEITATLQFDPKDFKITLEDQPKAADSKPAKGKDAEKPKKNEDEKKPKDEDQ